MMSQSVEWWDSDCSATERAGMLCSEAQRIAKDNATREALIVEAFRLYGTTNDRSLTVDAERCSFNAMASATDTLVAEVTQVESDPVVVAVDGGYRKQRQAERITAHCEQRFKDFDAHRLLWLAARDAVIAGMGFVRAYDDGVSSAPLIERLHPLSVLVDDASCVDIEPRELYVRRAPARSRMAALWPDRKEQVEAAAAPKASYWYSMGGQTRADRVVVYEAWHLPSSPDAGDGRHCICLDGPGEPLLDEQWDGTRYPIAVVRCLDASLGWWGDMLSYRMLGAQKELEKLMLRVQDSMHLHAVQRCFVQAGSVITSQFNNDVDGIIEYSGTQAPIFPPTPTMPADVFGWIPELKKLVFESAGIPELMASGAKPPGVNSAVGMRTLTRFASKRFIHFERSYERATCHLAEDLIAAERSIAERKEGAHKVAYRWAGRTYRQPWSEIDLPQDDIRVEVLPANALRKDAAGRLEDTYEMVDRGIIDNRQALRMLGHPDVDALRREQTAAEDLIRDTIGAMLDGGEYQAPDETMDYASGLRIAVQLMSAARLAGATTDELEPVRRWIADFKALQLRQAQREAEIAEAGHVATDGERMVAARMGGGGPMPMPPGMPPGAPPMPPGPMPSQMGGVQ